MEEKNQLVDAIRMLEKAGYIDHNGHCSARRDANSFYINSGASVLTKQFNQIYTSSYRYLAWR